MHPSRLRLISLLCDSLVIPQKVPGDRAGEMVLPGVHLASLFYASQAGILANGSGMLAFGYLDE